MLHTESPQPSLQESFKTIPINPQWPWWRKMLAFAGPGYLVAVGYMDPGNWATDLAAGSAFNYKLLSVVFLSNMMAILLQYLAAKLGIARGRDLAQACKEYFSPAINFILWILCEVAICACDLAEIIGSAIALKLLFGIPLVWGVGLTTIDVFALLSLQRGYFRYLEWFVVILMSIIAGCFLFELIVSQPSIMNILHGLIPHPDIITHPNMLYLAIGIIGATVMPHNLYLHSSVVQTRGYERTPSGKKEALHFITIDTTCALMLAFCINAAILIIAASVFHSRGYFHVTELEEAYRLLTPLLNVPLASTLFALALLASGQNSAITGTLAGQIVMEGFLNIQLAPWLRRFITRGLAVIPAFICVLMYGESEIAQLLLISQIILSFQLTFAVIPLIIFTSDKEKMGSFVNSWAVSCGAWLSAGIIISLNMLYIFNFFSAALLQ